MRPPSRNRGIRDISFPTLLAVLFVLAFFLLLIGGPIYFVLRWSGFI